MLLTPAPVKGKGDWIQCSKHSFDTEHTAAHVGRVKKSLSEGALRPSDLLAQFKQIEATTRTQIWAAELLDNTVELIREMVYTHTMVQPNPDGTERLAELCPHLLNWGISVSIKVFICTICFRSPQELLSEGDMENLLQVTGCSAELQTPSCVHDCLSERYRSITGECNNKSVGPQTNTPRRVALLDFLITVSLLCSCPV